MNAVDESVETLSHAILDEARAEADQLKGEAGSRAEGIRQRAREEAERVRKQILEQARQEAERLHSQALATVQLKARSTELEHREQLLEQVFKAVREQLPAVPKKPDYSRVARRLVLEALSELKVEKAVIHPDKTTQKVLTDQLLADITRQSKVKLSLGNILEEGTGVVVETDDSRLHFDNTLENRLSRAQNNLRAAVYRILMGESA